MVKMCRRGTHQYDNSQNRCCPQCQKDAHNRWRLSHLDETRVHKAKKHAENRAHNNARSTAFYRQNQATERMKRGGVKYGISAKEYAERVVQPCSICGHIEKAQKMHVDHDHESGKLRGTLCHECNIGLGLFDDSPARLLAAVEYLAHYGIGVAHA